jgi:hypothetical protein
LDGIGLFIKFLDDKDVLFGGGVDLREAVWIIVRDFDG